MRRVGRGGGGVLAAFCAGVVEAASEGLPVGVACNGSTDNTEDKDFSRGLKLSFSEVPDKDFRNVVSIWEGDRVGEAVSATLDPWYSLRLSSPSTCLGNPSSSVVIFNCTSWSLSSVDSIVLGVVSIKPEAGFESESGTHVAGIWSVGGFGGQASLLSTTLGAAGTWASGEEYTKLESFGGRDGGAGLWVSDVRSEESM